jgi:hypothetical protein
MEGTDATRKSGPPGEVGFADEQGASRQRGEVPRELGHPPLVVMLEAADIGKLDDLPELWWLHGAWIGTVHTQRSVNPPAMIVLKGAGQDAL